MPKSKSILIYEYGWLEVGLSYGNESKVEFEEIHYHLLENYLTKNPDCPYYSLFGKKIKFNNYVGVIKVKDLSIEILPKTDRHQIEKRQWQSILLEMLTISFQVKAKTTTLSDIHVKQHTVLETYLQLFLEGTERLIHTGLVKKYRKEESNRPVLKGKLLLHKHLSKNIMHADRFYVSQQVYDLNNIFNSILEQTLRCIESVTVSESIKRLASKMLLHFPECKPLNISEKLFAQLKFDRKTERYKPLIELARMILLNFHPDVKGGNNNILAIMFDMNRLWQSYIFKILYNASMDYGGECRVLPHETRDFWKHPDGGIMILQPDIVFQYKKQVVVLDTKWKYQKDSSPEDIRQMYTYGNYWKSNKRYLIYPDKAIGGIEILEGTFYDNLSAELAAEDHCGLMFVDLINEDGSLNKALGKKIIEKLISSIRSQSGGKTQVTK